VIALRGDSGTREKPNQQVNLDFKDCF